MQCRINLKKSPLQMMVVVVVVIGWCWCWVGVGLGVRVGGIGRGAADTRFVVVNTIHAALFAA